MSLSSSSKVPARQWLSRKTLTSGAGLIALVAFVKLLAHLLVAGNFGYFRDELYYIDSGRHFQTGYVDFCRSSRGSRASCKSSATIWWCCISSARSPEQRWSS